MPKNNGLERKQISGFRLEVETTTQPIEDDPNELGKKLGPINPKGTSSVAAPRASVISKADSQLNTDSSISNDDDNGVDIPPLPPELTGAKQPLTSQVNPQNYITDCRRDPDFGFSVTSPYFFPRQHQFLPGYENQRKRFNNAAKHQDHPDLEPKIPFGDDNFRPSFG